MSKDEIEGAINALIQAGMFPYPLLSWLLGTPLQPMLVSQMAGYISEGR